MKVGDVPGSISNEEYKLYCNSLHINKKLKNKYINYMDKNNINIFETQEYTKFTTPDKLISLASINDNSKGNILEKFKFKVENDDLIR